MSDDLYFWCSLRNGAKRTCGYIEERGAKLGARVEMVDLDGEFWTVTSVGASVTKEYVRAHEKAFKDFQGSLKGGGINQGVLA
jgi:hypothetical protein